MVPFSAVRPAGSEFFLKVSPASSLTTQLITGRQEILVHAKLLIELSERYGQTGAMDHLDFFLTSEDSLKKTPHLILLKESGESSEITAQTVVGAVLVHEYRVFGIGTGIFATADSSGQRTLIGPPELRSMVAARAAEFLMKRGGRTVLISFEEVSRGELRRYLQLEARNKENWEFATMLRGFRGSFRIEKTYEETLAKLGKHTRRNLRYYRRRVETELGCVFVPQAVLSEAEFLQFNRDCAHQVTPAVMARRYKTTHEMEGALFAGVKTSSGEWLSLIGGRKHHGVTEIDWQMNRGGFANYSLSTVMRSFLIESEVASGTKSLDFEGGTPHSMRFAFEVMYANDLLVARRSIPVYLLRKFARRVMPSTNFLAQMLADPKRIWQAW